MASQAESVVDAMFADRPREPKKYAIGVPGQPIRMYYDTANPDHALAQLKEGEVALEVTESPMDHSISLDQKTLVPRSYDVDELRLKTQSEVLHEEHRKLREGVEIEGIGKIPSEEQDLEFLTRMAIAANSSSRFTCEIPLADGTLKSLTNAQIKSSFAEVMTAHAEIKAERVRVLKNLESARTTADIQAQKAAISWSRKQAK